MTDRPQASKLLPIARLTDILSRRRPQVEYIYVYDRPNVGFPPPRAGR